MAGDIFLKLKGIEGEAQDKDHGGAIDVMSWSWGISQSGTTHMGSGAGGGKASVNDLMLDKFVDKSTPILMDHSLRGVHIPDGELIVRKAGGKPLEYLKIKMEKILVTSSNIGGMGGEGDRVTESLTLNFAKVKVVYVEQKPDGGEGAKPEFVFDIAMNSEA